MDDDADLHLATRMDKLRRHWRWILEGAGACSMVALLVSLFLPRIYRATTYILISQSKIGQGSSDSPWQQMAMLPTYVPFVDNDAFIKESLARLHLDRLPYNLTAEQFRRKGYLDVRVPKSTRLLELNVEFPDARLAAAIANDLAHRAIQFNDKMTAADTSATQAFLKKQLEAANERLARAADRRLKVQQEARMDNLQKDLGILLAEKERLSTQIEQLSLALAQDDSRVKVLKQALATQPRTYRLKKSITADRFFEREAEKLDQGAQPLSMTEEQLNTTREGIQQDLVRATVSAASENAGLNAARSRLAQVNKQAFGLLDRITALRNKIDLADQEYALAFEAVKTASREYENASVTVSSKSQDLKQIAPAIVPERPVRPKIVLNTLLGFVLGAMLCGSAALMIENARERRRSSGLPAGEIDQAILQRN